MSTETTSDTDLGTVETDGDKYVIRFERRLDHPIEEVWAAITEPDEMIKWWGEGEVDLVEGGKFVVKWLNTDEAGNRAVMTGTITSLEPPHLLETASEEHGDLRWELRPDGDATKLNFSSKLELPEEFRTMNAAGWHWHLDALATVLAGGEVELAAVEIVIDSPHPDHGHSPTAMRGWNEIHQRYVAKLG